MGCVGLLVCHTLGEGFFFFVQPESRFLFFFFPAFKRRGHPSVGVRVLFPHSL